MKFQKYYPSDRLKAYIKYFVVSENETENEYKVYPSSGMVIGFQYKGKLAQIVDNNTQGLSSAGITGISTRYKIFRNSKDIGTILVYFTEYAFIHFAKYPANELFNLSISLEDIFDKSKVREVEEKLYIANSDMQRINIVESFLLNLLKDIAMDKMVIEAIKLIYQNKGNIKISDLIKILSISQSPFEKRFRKVVGSSAKKFASIVRFNNVLDNISQNKYNNKSLIDISYENNYFDQAHFIKDFKQYTGETPEKFIFHSK